MNIILKNSLKNIFGKFFRTLLVTFAIFTCSLCALICFDLGSSLEKLITGIFASVSRADIMVSAGGSDLTELPEGFPEADYMKLVCNTEILYKPIDGEYCYVTTEYLNIYGIDMDEAVDMKFISPMDLPDGEIFVTTTFADEFGYEIGDKITVHDRASEEMELTIGGFIPDDNKNPILSDNTGIVNLNTSDDLSCGYRETDVILVDLKDDSKIEEAKDILKDNFPDVTITDMFLTDSDMEMVNEIKAVFYLLFAVTFLLVIFVTASICNRIVSERMSFIGTLRSLGMSTAGTGRILLLENVLYALLGSLPATILYCLVRDPIMNVMFIGTDSNGDSVAFDIPKLSVALVIGVILGAVIIECLIPLKSILKALNTSIRDIIFDNRDTEYRYGKTSLIFGFICLGITVITFIFRHNIIAAILCLVSTVVALALLFPRLLKLIATGIQKFSDKHNMPSWSLAAVEARSRKSTVSSGVLSATAAAMCILVYTIATAMAGSLETMPYDCDVLINCTKQTKYYSYVEHIEGVTGTEALFCSTEEIAFNDEEKSTYCYVYGLPDEGFKYFTGFKDLPETLEDGKCIIDSKYASRKGISEGDVIKLTLNPHGVFPVVREYEVQKIIDPNAYDQGTEAIIVSEKEFKAMLLDYPNWILVKTDDPESVKQTIEDYGKGTYINVQTIDELIETSKSDNSKTMAVITTIIVVALGMTAIGMISNQLIGFEGRKKECAVMLSTAMNKGKLSGILLLEVLITSLTASATGTLIGTALIYVIKAGLDNTTSLSLDLQVDPVKTILFFVILTVVFTLTVLFPMKNLRKMKISEQIKYE